MSRTVIALVAVGAIVIAVALGVAWRVKERDQAAMGAGKSAPAAAAPTPRPAAASEAKNQAQSPPQAAQPAPAPAPSPEPQPAPSAAIGPPTFDVARIGADGRAVIAGRAQPGAKIVLLDGGKEIANGMADPRGEWVLLVQEPPLTPGQHELRVVQHIEGRAPVTSEQVVVAVVPEPADKKAETLVMISPPGGASKLLQPPSAAGTPKSNDLQLSTLDYDEKGRVTITGQASAGATVRAYVDDKIAAEGAADKDNHWHLAPAEPVAPGKHRLRLDRLGNDGKPVARLELTFERMTPAPATPESKRLTVIRGDNLWNIARAHYGEGWRYTVIFEANKSQIRDPDLIYPGQVFAIPKLN
jgi:nucleoid-associated protein YgaU